MATPTQRMCKKICRSVPADVEEKKQSCPSGTGRRGTHKFQLKKEDVHACATGGVGDRAQTSYSRSPEKNYRPVLAGSQRNSEA